MVEFIQSIDRDIMVLLNCGDAHTSKLDFFEWMMSQILVWIPIFILFLYTIIKNKRKESLLIAGITILVFLLCDQISSGLLKPWIARPRPSHDPLIMDMLSYVHNYKGGSFGFPSSHAANSFGFAVFSSLLFHHRAYTFLSITWATLCAYSRIYLGVHFPGDILCGALLGITIGFFCHWIYLKGKSRWFGGNNYPKNETTITGFLVQDINRIIFTLCIILFSIIACALQI